MNCTEALLITALSMVIVTATVVSGDPVNSDVVQLILCACILLGLLRHMCVNM